MKFKASKASFEFLVIYIILALVFLILGMMYLRISRTTDESAVEVLREKNQFVSKELDLFFKPVQERIEEEHQFVFMNENTKIDSVLQAYRAFSMEKSNPVISSMVIADTFGTQEFYGRLRNINKWYYFKSHLGNKTERLPDVKIWHYDDFKFVLDTQYLGHKSNYDSRERPWFQSTLRSSELQWTQPYMFATADVPGMTISKQVKTSPVRIVVFDVTLESLSLKTSNIIISENGFTFVITDSAKVIGLPHKAYANSIDSIKKFALKDIHILDNKALSAAYDEWKKFNKPNFKMDIDDITYWVQFSPYVLGNVVFYVGIVAPEKEIIGPIIKTKNLLFYGLIFILIFSVFASYFYRQKQKANVLITQQKLEVEQQKHLVEEKHREITDSINYAKRIQRSFIATKELLDENLKEYFVLFKPKDVVSGDFYWAGKLNNDNFALVTADSTGHGVPGAIMSLLNITSLEKAIETLNEPSEILNATRKTIIERLKKDGSEHGGKDGMDASLLAFDFKNKKVYYAGANSPVWIIREGSIIEIKPDKMPIGKHDKDSIPFTQQTIDLQRNDVIYTITDGYPDQFGGPLGKKFMSKNLKELVKSNSHLPMEEQKALLDSTFKKWVGNLEQVDDICVIGIRL